MNSGTRTALAKMLGLDAQRVADGTWMVQRRSSARPLTVDTLDDEAWLVQPRQRRRRRVRTQALAEGAWLLRRGDRAPQAHPVGRPDTSMHLVYEQRAAREHMAQVQRMLGQWLADEEIAWMLRRLRIDVVLDVGANTGQYARRLREGGYTGVIHSFEPVREFHELLAVHAADDPDWHVHPYALGDADTEMEINTTPGRKLSSLLPASDFGKDWNDALSTPVKETIRIRRLDSVYADLLGDRPDARILLKTDTQGYDLAVFRGAKGSLDRVVGMQSEVACVPIYEGMPDFAEQISEYRAEGFDIAGLYPVTVHRPSLRVIEFDLLMVRGEAAARPSDQD